MSEELSLFQANYGSLVLVIALILGLCVGSFLNVVIVRLPIILKRKWVLEANEILDLESPPREDGISLSQPGSHCPNCKARIRLRHNIPVVSYVRLFGKCASCGKQISSRYPSIELATGGLTAYYLFSRHHIYWSTGMLFYLGSNNVIMH